MTNPPPDWQEIAKLLVHLEASRCEVRGLCQDEFQLVESATHYVNKKLDGFAFDFIINHVKQDSAVATLRIDLRNLHEGEALPWSYHATYFYAGHCDAFFARAITEGEELQAVERKQHKIGEAKDPHWQWVLMVIATLNLRDTPRQAVLV